MQLRSAQTATRTTRATITADHSDPALIAARAGEALYARSHPEHQLSEPARAFTHMSLVDHARASLQRAGLSTTGLSADTIITRATTGIGYHSTSDFPMIMGEVVNRELRRAYQAAPSGLRQVARQSTFRDFRPKGATALGGLSQLTKVAEGGEFPFGTIKEGSEFYRLETFGKIFAISRQAMVNDDLGAFTTIPARLGVAARAFEAAQLAMILMANPVMSDAKTVFHADHGNTKAAGASLEDDLAAARLAMRKQTGVSGDLIDVTPRFVVVPPDLETAMEKALSAVQAAKTADANPFTNLTLVVDPRLTPASRWYVAADPALIDGLEYAYLEGTPGPQVETRTGFEVDGVQMKVRLDFGCGWIDHRSWFRVG